MPLNLKSIFLDLILFCKTVNHFRNPFFYQSFLEIGGVLWHSLPCFVFIHLYQLFLIRKLYLKPPGYFYYEQKILNFEHSVIYSLPD